MMRTKLGKKENEMIKMAQDMKAQKVVSIIMLILVNIFMVGCRNELSRKEAEKIIRKEKGYPKSLTLKLRFGRISEGNISIMRSWREYLASFEKLSSMGLIDLKRLGRVASGTGIFRITQDTVEISLTDKGKKEFTYENNNIWKTEFCKKVLVGVTGMVKENDTRTKVEYQWKYDEFSPYADALIPFSEIRNKNKDKLYSESAVFAKYDDGWRLAE